MMDSIADPPVDSSHRAGLLALVGEETGTLQSVPAYVPALSQAVHNRPFSVRIGSTCRLNGLL
jgi:hypothetical protein